MRSIPAPGRTGLMRVRRGYVAVAGRAVHYRTCGQGPALVMLHDSPRSSRLHLATMAALGERFTVWALDTPGYGNSDPLGFPSPTIPDFAAALGATLTALGLDRAPLYATHTSAKIALALAVRGGTMPLLVLDGLSLPEQPVPAGFIAAYMRPFRIDDSGAYLAAEWSRTRDMLRWFPWFTADPAARMAIDPPETAWLDDYLIDLLSAGPHYADAYAAAMRWNALPDLESAAVPTVVMARRDDVLFGALDRVPVDGNPRLAVERLGPDRGAWLDRLRTLFGAVPEGVQAEAGAASAPDVGYRDGPHGQLHWTRHGRGTPALVLSAPTTLQAHGWARALADGHAALVPDLPGFGESDPLPGTDPARHADAIADALADLIAAEAGGPALVVGIGLASPLARRLAERHPAAVARLVIDGAPPTDPAAAARFGAGLCPPVETDPLGGGHLHRLWHLLRDGEVQWPWHDGRPAAARRLAPRIAGADLHPALVGVLKQPNSWGQAAAAALACAGDAANLSVPTMVLRHPDPAHAEAAALAAHLPRAHLVDRPDDLAAAARLVAQLESLDDR